MTDADVLEMTDEEFREMFALFCERDREAYERMFLYLQRKLESMVSPALRRRFARVGEKADTDDVLHDVLCRMIPYLLEKGEGCCEGVSHFHRLTARILRHTLIDLQRKHFGSMRSQPIGEWAEAFGSKLGQSSGMERWRTRTSVHELVDKLDPQDQEVIELAIYSNLKNAELARCLGVSEGQASRRFGRAKERLGQLIFEERQKSG
jgi:RNA polymerase sigma factor (sigma-70 family)